MTLLILFFLLLVFLTANTMREQWQDLNAFTKQQKLLAFAFQTHDIAYLLHIDNDNLDLNTSQTASYPNALPSIQKLLDFHNNSSSLLQNQYNLETFSEQQIEAAQQLIQPSNPNPAASLLIKLQETTLQIHDRLIEHLITLHPNENLVKAKNLSQILRLYYNQNNLIQDGLAGGVNLKLLFNMLETAKKESQLSLTNRSAKQNPLDPKQPPYQKKLNTVQQVEKLLEKSELLSKLEKQLGYGGFIHNFKNLVIRGPENYETPTRIKLLETVRTIDYLSIQHALNAKSRIDLIETRNVIFEYAKNLETVINEWKKGTNVKQIDAMVKIDDSPAAIALIRLHKEIYLLGLKSLDEDIDKKIHAVYIATSETYNFLDTIFSGESQKLKQRLFFYISGIALGSIILFVVVAILTQRLINRITHIKKVLHHLETYTDLDIRADADNKDEIGDIASLLNNAIEHRKKIEIFLEDQTKRAQQAADAKSKFLSGMSHEMKTPLNSIIGYSHRLLSKITDKESREYDALQTIKKNGERLLDRVNHILKLVDIEDSKEIHSQVTNITHLKQAFKNLLNTEYSNPIEINWQINDPGINLAGPDSWISDIATHLCAPENFPEQSTISVTISNHKDNCEIKVTYDDPSASCEKISSLFHESQGLIDPNKKAHEGSHLNLAIVKSIIDRLYGTIEAEVQDDKVTYVANLKIVWNYSI